MCSGVEWFHDPTFRHSSSVSLLGVTPLGDSKCATEFSRVLQVMLAFVQKIIQYQTYDVRMSFECSNTSPGNILCIPHFDQHIPACTIQFTAAARHSKDWFLVTSEKTKEFRSRFNLTA